MAGRVFRRISARVRAAVVAAMTFTMAACGGGGDGGGGVSAPPAVGGVTVTLPNAQLQVGAQQTAAVEVRSTTGAVLTGRTVSWASSNSSVATVADGGVIVGVAPGTVSVTATSEGKVGTAALTVVPIPVASVSLVIPQSTLLPGGTTQVVAEPRDAAGRPLTGRVVNYVSSNPAVASVNGSGLVTALAPGSAVISATSEGQTGQATLQVLVPVASVVISGSSRVKVGDSYSYTATARAADNSIIERPITWSVREAGRAVITPNGTVTPLQPGTFTLVTRIDGDDWVTTLTAYDWEAFSSGGSGFITLDADVRVANRNGTLEYPELIVSCAASAPFFLWVSTPHIITASGTVALSFDGGAPFGQTWQELSPNFRTLWKPGSSSTVLAFAQQVAASRLFGFAFGEFNGSAKATLFRVTGMATALRTMVNTYCPALASLQRGTLVAAEPSAIDVQRVMEARARVVSGRTHDVTPSDDARERAERGPVGTPSALLNAWPVWPMRTQMTARRVPR